MLTLPIVYHGKDTLFYNFKNRDQPLTNQQAGKRLFEKIIIIKIDIYTNMQIYTEKQRETERSNKYEDTTIEGRSITS